MKVRISKYIHCGEEDGNVKSVSSDVKKFFYEEVVLPKVMYGTET